MSNDEDNDLIPTKALIINEQIIITTIALSLLNSILFGFFIKSMFVSITSALIFLISFIVYLFIIGIRKGHQTKMNIGDNASLPDLLPTQSRSNKKIYDYSLFSKELNVLVLFNKNSDEVYLEYENGDYEDITIDIKHIEIEKIITELKHHIYDI